MIKKNKLTLAAAGAALTLPLFALPAAARVCRALPRMVAAPPPAHPPRAPQLPSPTWA